MNKRLTDILLSSLGLVVLAPVMIIVAIWIIIDSPGPVLFRQERVGRYGKIFRIRKFRTMAHNSEQQGLQITVGADKRVTRAGRWLRRHKIDELPQLIDVLIGNMSLVGPRPEVPRYVAHYPSHTREIVLSLRPGITDQASIEFRNESEILGKSDDPSRTYVEEILPLKLKYHLDYAKNQSFLIDLTIILRTLKSLLL